MQHRFDIIGDVHGQLAGLRALGTHLGYDVERDWAHPEGRVLVFVGDLIDRGEDSLGVAELVMGLVHEGRALCLMGNHEYNLVGYALGIEQEKHSNRPTIAATKERPARWAAVIEFFRTLPIAIELPELRIVHAVWHLPSLQRVEPVLRPRPAASSGVSTTDWLRQHVVLGSPFAESGLLAELALLSASPAGEDDAHEVLLKGYEAATDPFVDGDGKERRAIRVTWWDAARPEIADDKITVFGHYWNLPPAKGRERLYAPPHASGTPELRSWQRERVEHVPARGFVDVPRSEKFICVDYNGVFDAGAGSCIGAYRWPEQRVAWARTGGPPTPAREVSYEDVLEGVVALDAIAVATSTADRVSGHEVGRRLAAVEREVQASPEACFAIGVDGMATLRAADGVYQAGRFTIPRIAELRERLAGRSKAATLRFSVLLGENALTDIGTLQAAAEPGVMFQVASQFNCLEAPSPRIVPVQQYVTDPTQGPRASVSAFPGTFLRHYRAPSDGGEVFTQTAAREINLLADALQDDAPAVRHGYLSTRTIPDAPALAKRLEDRFDQIRVGVHDDVEVVFGHNWGGPIPDGRAPRVAQLFTSTIAMGGYGRDDGSPALATIRRQLLRGAYLGTMLAALDLGKHTVLLTLIGGGVFGNPHRDILDAIDWACTEAESLAPRSLHVVLNARALDRSLSPEELQEMVSARGGLFADRARPSRP